MKRIISIITLTSGLMFIGAKAQAHFEIDASVEINATADFDAPLSTCGAWVDVPTYGRCWHPAGVAVEWRPYCDGYWEWTECGWYWVSDEPWSWACYHYGRWVISPGFGWIWIPDVDWGPAWVCWREGGGYIGWAPLTPRFHGSVIVGADVAPAAFVFVGEGHFQDHHRRSNLIINNTTIINKTTNITRIRTENRSIANVGTRKVAFNEGPSVTQLSKTTGRQYRQTPIRELAAKSRPPAMVTRKAAVKPETRQPEKVEPRPEKVAPRPERVAPPSRKAPPVEERKVAPPPREEPSAPKERPDKPPARIIRPEPGERRPPVVRPQPVRPREEPNEEEGRGRAHEKRRKLEEAAWINPSAGLL